MEDSAAILCQISSFKDMIDQVNEEIESSIQITRQLESEIISFSEIEAALSVREAELTKLHYSSQFELNGLIAVTIESRNSAKHLEEELCRLKLKREEIVKRMNDKREGFVSLCLEFQKGISQRENDDLGSLLSEKEFLENEIDRINGGDAALTNSTSAYMEAFLGDLHDSNTALQVEIQKATEENEKLVKDIEELKRRGRASALLK
ncbi:hypothetical protein CRG98_009260 [Punica granatum]|uniref:Uncharacterized protein n=1 Tax=Punica granatum TaxID=22663 RepID=A0A2I0KPW3_PUNGR|nr:hypothetical protein CRG98_009260 [Punica granatum]